MDRLLPLARARGGVVTAALAGTVGTDEHALVAARRAGSLVRLRRDVYVLAEPWNDADPTARLALRTRGTLASRSDEAIATHESALALHRLPLLAPVPTVVDLWAPVTRARRYGSVRVAPTGPERPVVADGYRVVPPAVAVAQVTLRSGLRAGIVAADAGLARGGCSRDDLVVAVDGRTTSRESRRRAAELVAMADPLAESAGADGRDALVAEKWREDELRAMGYIVVRVTWADLDHPERIDRLVRRAVAAAGTAVA